MDETRSRPAPRGKPKDPEGNRSAILAASVAEFAARSFHGGRADTIAQESGCDKQLLYYHYSSKEGLYIAAREYAYAQARLSQADLPVDPEDPLRSLIDIVLAAFDFVTERQDVIRLIANENVEKARFRKQSSVVRDINAPISEKLEEILTTGAEKCLFRSDLDALELHSREAYRSTIEKVVSGFVLLPRPSPATAPDTRANGMNGRARRTSGKVPVRAARSRQPANPERSGVGGQGRGRNVAARYAAPPASEA